MKDTRLRLIGIPLLSFIAPVLVEGVRPFEPGFLQMLLFSFLATASIWEGNRFIVLKLRRKLSWEKGAELRLVVQIIAGGLFTVLVISMLWKLFQYLGLYRPIQPKIFHQSLLASIMITLMMNAIYESIYFSRRWRFSFMRAEVLKRNNLHTQYESLKNTVNPHFLFNSLNTLTTLIEEDSNQAGRFVQDLSNVYRYLLQSRNNRLASLSEEKKFVEDYLYLLQVRYGNRLRIVLSIAAGALTRAVPPLALQILVENAVKHNIVSCEKPLYIRIFTEDDSWVVVTNNLQPKPALEEYAKLGLQNIRQQYLAINAPAPEVIRDEHNFTVRLPLLKNE